MEDEDCGINQIKENGENYAGNGGNNCWFGNLGYFIGFLLLICFPHVISLSTNQ